MLRRFSYPVTHGVKGAAGRFESSDWVGKAIIQERIQDCGYWMSFSASALICTRLAKAVSHVNRFTRLLGRAERFGVLVQHVQISILCL
ncbi:hypothetical protein VTK56DRAFT_3753 [Thermocarpiscus australiensis]